MRARSCPARPRASPQPSTVADVPAASGAGVMPAPSQPTELFSVFAVRQPVRPARPVIAGLLQLSTSCYQHPAVTTDKKCAAGSERGNQPWLRRPGQRGAAAAVALHTSRAPASQQTCPPIQLQGIQNITSIIFTLQSWYWTEYLLGHIYLASCEFDWNDEFPQH